MTSKAYTFERENIHFLKNPDRSQIIEAFDQFARKLAANDNLLIFYSGHGFWDEKLAQGFWLPSNARQKTRAEWLSNSTIRDYVGGIKTQHTLLVSDACFSGGIFKARSTNDIRRASIDIQLLYAMPSRRAMTSGTNSSVPDESVFFKYLMKYLEENEKPFISSSELFNSIRRGVMNNSLRVPQEGVIMNTGDEGGDFIFIRRN